MCKCFDYNDKVHNEEHPDEAFPKVLLALIRLERKANLNYSSVQETFTQVDEMRSILTKLTTTHIDSDNYADYLFKRAEQLSAHLETYKNIIGKIDIGNQIQENYKKISVQFMNYLKRRIEFKTLWIESLQTIEIGKRTAEEKLVVLGDLRLLAKEAFQLNDYFELADIKTKCDQELNVMNELMESCFNCGKLSKELGSQLYDQLTELEVCFQEVVKHSMDRICEMKRTPTSDCVKLE